MCEFCRGTGIIRFGGVVGKNPSLTAPCGHCSKGAKEKVKMEMAIRLKQIMRKIEPYRQ
jgi:hypothetical protein